MIKFQDHYVQNMANGEKVKVYYSLDNHTSGKPCISISAKGYDGDLSMFAIVENNSDMMSDYCEKDRVRLFEEDTHYTQARKAAEKKIEKQKIKRYKRRI